MASGTGMSVPGASDLGLGSSLSQQVSDETDEERKKRLLQQQQQRIAPGSVTPSAPGASSLMSGYSAVTPFP